jgi:cytoskeleton protein RodZ
VNVQRNGQAQDLTPYLRANVARFTVSSDGSLAPAVD